MTAPTATALSQPKIMRDRLDWLLLVASVCMLPWLLVYCADVWFRTDYRFFPVLLLLPLGMAVWRGELRGSLQRTRERWGWALWVLGGGLGCVAGWLFSPWLALAALTAMWTAWSLMRFASTPWPQVAAWSLPWVALLALPLSDASDPVFSFAASVTRASSSLLDLVGVPQMPSELALELRHGQINVSSVCHGLGNPYLLGAFTLLLCLLTRPSLLIAGLTVLSVPMWAWGGCVVLVWSASVLVDHVQLHLLVGYRLWLCQVVVLLAELVAIWFFQRGLIRLFAPFVAYSEGVGKWHKFYNSTVLWPAPDPLRKRKPRESVVADQPEMSSPGTPTPMLWLAAAAFLLLAGGIGFYRLAAGRAPTGRPGWQTVTQPRLSAAEVQRWTAQEALPEELAGMQLIAFEMRPTTGTSTANSWTARWTYAHQQRTVQLAIALPWRGFYPRERQWLLDGATRIEDRQQWEAEVPEDGRAVLLDEVAIKDTLAGPSYLAYASWSPNGSLARSPATDPDRSWRAVLAGLTYQPSTASLSLFVPGVLNATAEERAEYRQILLTAVDQF